MGSNASDALTPTTVKANSIELANVLNVVIRLSPPATPFFHKVRFPILKALYIVYFVATNKQGISSTELSRKLVLRQKTCQSFKRKVMIAMASSQDYPLKDKVKVDETVRSTGRRPQRA